MWIRILVLDTGKKKLEKGLWLREKRVVLMEKEDEEFTWNGIGKSL